MSLVFVSVTGDKQLDKALRKLGDKEMPKVIRAGVRAAATHVAREAKELAKSADFADSVGAYWRSIGVKSLKVRRKSGGTEYVAKIGPRSMFIKDRAASKESGKEEFKRRHKKDLGGRNPIRYAHILEFGSRYGRKEFKIMRKALYDNERQHQDIAAGKMRSLIAKAARKARGA